MFDFKKRAILNVIIFHLCNVCRNTESPLWPESYWSQERSRKYSEFLDKIQMREFLGKEEIQLI